MHLDFVRVASSRNDEERAFYDASRPRQAEIADDQGHGKRVRDGRLLGKLWIIVRALWICASLLRVDRVWVPVVGWPSIPRGPWFWLTLVLPPAMFGIIILVAQHAGRRS